MNVDELIDTYPRLYHMAEAGSWPAIAEHGLLPTADIVASSALGDDERAAIVDRQRLTTVAIDHPALGGVVIRDQAPLRRALLEAALTDMSPDEWLALLNDRVFFWLRPQRLAKLLDARRYRNREHDVLVLDTATLVNAHRDRIRLSAINSGAALFPGAPARGSTTFQTIEDYPFADRRKGRGLDTAIAELAVIGGVPDVRKHVVTVQRRRGSEVVAVLFPSNGGSG